MTTGIYVTTNGLQIPTVEDLLALCVGDQRGLISPDLDTDPESPIGQLNGIFCSHLEEAYEILLIAYNGFNRDAAEDFLLDALGALTGTPREPATASLFKGTRQIQLTLAANTTVPGLDGAPPPGGTVFSQNGNPLVRFDLLTTVVSTTSGTYLADAVCELTGPINCNAGTLTVIATPVVGLLAVNNPLDAELGQAEDTDTVYRIRQEEDLRAAGKGTVDSLRADILSITLDDGTEPILSCIVLQNVTMVTDANGLPPKSVECIVYDGLIPECPDTTLAQVIWTGKPGGIQLNGTSTAIAIDGEGAQQIVNFTRPTILEVKFNLSLLVDPTTYAGDQAAKTAVANQFIAKVHPGSTIRCADYIKALLNTAGILDVLTIQIAFVGNPYPASFTNLVLAIRQQGDADTSNMAIATTPGSP